MPLPLPKTNKCCVGGVKHFPTGGNVSVETGVEGAGTDQWYDSANGFTPIIRVTSLNDDGEAVTTWLDAGGNEVPFSSSFTPQNLGETVSVKFLTDTVTGAFREVTQVKNLVTNTVLYYAADATPTMVGSNEIVADYVSTVNLGELRDVATPGTPLAPSSIPTEARFATVTVIGADAVFSIGATGQLPLVEGAYLELQSRYEIENVTLDSADGTTPMEIVYVFYNAEPTRNRT